MLNRTHMSITERGVSLIEVAVGLVIVGITLALGFPSMAEWLQNGHIRTAAEGVQNGLQIARGEAVRRNTNVEFVLSNPGTAGGTGWTVRTASGTLIQSRPDGEGSATAILNPTPSDATTVTFNGFGRPAASNADGSALLTRTDVDSTVLSSAVSRDLRVLISSGGQIKMCDPNVSATTDPRSC